MNCAGRRLFLIAVAFFVPSTTSCAEPSAQSAFRLIAVPRAESHAKTKRSANHAEFASQFSAPIPGGLGEAQLLAQSSRSISVRIGQTIVGALNNLGGKSQTLIGLDVPQELDDKPVLLRLTADDPSHLAVEVRTPSGRGIPPLPGRPGQYLLDPAQRGTFEIRSALTVPLTAGNTNGVALNALVEPGPILAGRMQILIHMGTKTSAYPQVGSLLLDGMIHCTATLVASHTALTAAHCVAGYENQIAQHRFAFGIGEFASLPQTTMPVTSADYPKDPSSGFFYSRMQGYKDDIAVVYLGGPAVPSTVAVHHGAPDWNALKAEELLFVGYGYNGADATSAGFKREASWKVDTVQARKIEWTTSGPSTCQFDSGGPAFTKGAGMVVGVTSIGAADCTKGIDTRVDAFWPWLSSRLQ